MSTELSNWQTVEWQPVIDGIKTDIPIPCLVTEVSEFGQDVEPVHVYTGYSEERFAFPATAKALAEIGLSSVLVGLPDSYTSDRSTLEMTAIEAPIAVSQWFNEQSGKPSGSLVDTVSHSKGGGVMLLSASHAPEQYGALGIIGPIGITNKYLGSTEMQRKLNFFLRLGVLNNLSRYHNPVTDPTNLLSVYEFGSRLFRDIRGGVLKAKLDLAFCLDLAEDTVSLAETNLIRLFVGRNDRLFTPAEYRDCLGNQFYTQHVQVVSGTHSPLVTKKGREQVKVAGEWVKTTRLGNVTSPYTDLRG